MRSGGRYPGAVLLAVLLAIAIPARGWEPVHRESGLLVERRPYAHSALQEIRGVTVVHASLNALMALLRDAPFNREWVYRSGGARILEESDTQAYVYGIVDAPWPMSDRDTVVRFDYRQDGNTKTILITITNFPDYIPSRPGLVRVPRFGGFWQLRPLGKGEVEVTYQVYGDPGGWIPVWLANRAAARSVTHTLQRLPEVVGRYASASAPAVAEPAAED